MIYLRKFIHPNLKIGSFPLVWVQVQGQGTQAYLLILDFRLGIADFEFRISQSPTCNLRAAHLGAWTTKKSDFPISPLWSKSHRYGGDDLGGGQDPGHDGRVYQRPKIDFAGDLEKPG